jgi:hypothetical protein
LSPNSDPEADCIPTFPGSIRIISCPELTVVDAEYILTCKTYLVSLQNIV